MAKQSTVVGNTRPWWHYVLGGLASLLILGLICWASVAVIQNVRAPKVASQFDPATCARFNADTGNPVDESKSAQSGKCEYPVPDEDGGAASEGNGDDGVASGDMGAVKIAQGEGVLANLKKGKFYHINHWCNSCYAGQENNWTGKAERDMTIKIWGTVWEYQRLPTRSEVWDARDFYPTSLPDGWDGLTLYPLDSLPLQATGDSREGGAPEGSPFLSGGEITSDEGAVVDDDNAEDAPVYVTGEVVEQGENKTYTLKAGEIYHLNAWFPGDEHEYDIVFEVQEDTPITFNGTLEHFTGVPSREHLPEPGGKHVYPDLSKFPALEGKVTQYQYDELE